MEVSWQLVGLVLSFQVHVAFQLWALVAGNLNHWTILLTLGFVGWWGLKYTMNLRSWGVGITDLGYDSFLCHSYLLPLGDGNPISSVLFHLAWSFWPGLGRKYFGCEWSYIFGWVGGIVLLSLATRSHYTVQAGSELSTLPSGEMLYYNSLQYGNETSWFHAKPFTYYTDNRQPPMWLL